MVGARSAVFAPVEPLGLVCVDEEHDASYKQDSDPRYDARTVAAKRGALENAVVVYGSATPRAESWEALERLDLGGRLGRVAAAGADRRPAPRARLPALRAAARRAGRDRGRGRQGDPPPEPPRRRAGDPLPRLRADAALRALRRRADAARGREAALPPLRARPARADAVPGLRRGRAGAPRRGNGAARGRAGREASGPRAAAPRRGHDRGADAAVPSSRRWCWRPRSGTFVASPAPGS